MQNVGQGLVNDTALGSQTESIIHNIVPLAVIY